MTGNKHELKQRGKSNTVKAERKQTQRNEDPLELNKLWLTNLLRPLKFTTKIKREISLAPNIHRQSTSRQRFIGFRYHLKQIIKFRMNANILRVTRLEFVLPESPPSEFHFVITVDTRWSTAFCVKPRRQSEIIGIKYGHVGNREYFKRELRGLNKSPRIMKI